MINLITGLPGSGKTLYMLNAVNNLAIKEGRTVYYHGIDELTLPWELMESPEEWVNLPSKSIIVIDECQSTFRPRAASVKPPLYVSEFETHRHKGLDFFLLTQHPMLIDGNIRRLAGKHYHVVRFFGFQKSTIHEFQSVRDNVDKNTKNSIATHFIFPKDVFNWYKSADAHTIKRRIPMRLVLMVVLPLVLLGGLIYGYQVFKRMSDVETLKKNAAGQTLNNNGSPISGNSSQPIKLLTYAESHEPKFAGLPHTALIYAKVTEPITAPYPAACVSSKKRGCLCYTQQGTVMNLNDAVCKNIVANGMFLDWNLEGQQKQDKAATLVKVEQVQPTQLASLDSPSQSILADLKPAIPSEPIVVRHAFSSNLR